MQRLKNKVFFTIALILTLSVISFLVIVNISSYIEEKTSVESSLETAVSRGRSSDVSIPGSSGIPSDGEQTGGSGSTGEIPPDAGDKAGAQTASGSDKDHEVSVPGSNVRFVDSVIYTVLLDEDDSIRDVINHSDNGLSDKEIRSIASGILKEAGEDADTSQADAKDPGSSMIRHTGNLYFEDDSYLYISGNSLTIFDNSTVSDSLWHLLKISALVFVIMELLFLAVAKLLTAWIIRPVQQSFDRQKQFIADASHELKTPLSVIMAYSEMLEEDPGHTSWLRSIRSEADRMNTLIMDLLRLASSEQEAQTPLQSGDLSRTVELAALTFEGKAYESGITLECDITPGITLDMHENSIRQLVEILLDNAVKHSASGETVSLVLKKQRGKPELTVTNRGDGIPAGEEEKIFERFYRSDTARDRSEGRFGLGLAIAKNIVNAHRGIITAASADGFTTFTVRF